MKEATTISSRTRPCSHTAVEECLERFGLINNARRISTPVADDAERRSRRIRIALQDLGPVFVAFGLYLSSRNDLLPAIDCLEFASLPDAAEPMAGDEVERLIAEECGRSLTQAFLYFDPVPFASRLVSQSHAALLMDGSGVAVKLIRTSFRKHLDDESHLLHLLKPALTCDEWQKLNLDHEIAAFRRSIRSQVDLAQQADFYEAMALDARDFDQLRVPALHRELCSSGMLTSGRILGLPLTDVLDQTEPTTEPERSAMARQLWLVWLRQALFGRAFPVEPRVADLSLHPNGQVAFADGSICPAAADSKKALAHYLIAVLNEDPDQACLCLLQQVTSTESHANTLPLRNSFRQATSFRCGDWRLGNRTDALAGRLFMHWQLLHKHEYELSDHLISFYRGLFLMNECCRRLAPAEDTLREAVEQLRATAVFEQFQDWLPLHRWKEDVGRYAGLMLELPKRLDDLLSLTANGTPALRIKIDEPVIGKEKSNLATVLSALCVGFAALTLFVPGVARWIGVSLGAERVVLMVVWLLLMLLLRSGQ